MATAPEDLTLVILREIRGGMNEMRPDVAHIEETLNEVRRTLNNHDRRFDALDEKFEAIREGTVSVIGFAAQASRAQADLEQQIVELTRRVEKLEAAK